MMKNISLAIAALTLMSACKETPKKEVNETITKDEIVMDKVTKNQKEIPAGVDFMASGENPSWSLLIDFDKSMTFTSLDTPKNITSPVPEARIPQDVNAVNYSAETENGILQVTIFKKPCVTDSDEAFSYKVRISTKTKNMENFKEFEGCGKYIGDYRLNDIWALESINGEAVPTDTKRPNLEFNLRTGKVFGFGGCNRINGTLIVEKDSLAIGELASTKMKCPNIEMETKFLQTVNNKKFQFSYENLLLTLKSDKDTLVFRKVD
ncbi:META domain-containing protein [Galbibacter sp. BG1]|uniref:META domain-containing protein n=1 Tax=Galbibacter sp. BG1 TaxID=1170699 RepID=UPI0015BF73C1|nr:META domain-containing protein [Galbibacter sp. BG1]QLE00851.1 META domain-containing protein [Galbibacter sp. BG1]